MKKILITLTKKKFYRPYILLKSIQKYNFINFVIYKIKLRKFSLFFFIIK